MTKAHITKVAFAPQ